MDNSISNNGRFSLPLNTYEEQAEDLINKNENQAAGKSPESRGSKIISPTRDDNTTKPEDFDSGSKPGFVPAGKTIPVILPRVYSDISAKAQMEQVLQTCNQSCAIPYAEVMRALKNGPEEALNNAMLNLQQAAQIARKKISDTAERLLGENRNGSTGLISYLNFFTEKPDAIWKIIDAAVQYFLETKKGQHLTYLNYQTPAYSNDFHGMLEKLVKEIKLKERQLLDILGTEDTSHSLELQNLMPDIFAAAALPAKT